MNQYNIHFSLDLHQLEFALQTSQIVTCSLVDLMSFQNLGELYVMDDFEINDSRSVKTNLKRKGEADSNLSQTMKLKKTANQSVVRMDVQSQLEDLNLLQDIGPNDKACAMCSYVASAKSSLKVHYQLKHLGGLGLIETCQVCGVQVKTKSYMKKHYMKIHNLSETAAYDMARR